MSGLMRFAMVFNFPNDVGNQCVMTGHVNRTGASTPDDSDVDNVMAVLSTWWTSGQDGEASLKSLVSSLCTLDYITCQKIQPTPPAAVRTLSVGTAGTSGSSALPPQCAVVLSLRTALSGRRYRGRMYLPGIPTSKVTSNGTLTTTDRQAYADSAKGMMVAMDALFSGSDELCVYSRVEDHKERVTSIRVGNRIDTQRRRKIPGETYVTGS